jgi:hypothetical protein
MIDNAVKLVVNAKRDNENQEEYDKWLERMQKNQKWVESHDITSVKVGDKIDVLDTEYIWCKATIELIIKENNHQDLLYLHYENWNRKYDEYLYIDSHRVAPLGLYTSRTDIPIYRMMNGSGHV